MKDTVNIAMIPEILRSGVLELAKNPEPISECLQGEQDGKADQAYNGAFRYVNKSPQDLKRLLDTEKNPKEGKTIQVALEFWSKKGGFNNPNDPRATTAGEPYRGDIKKADTPKDIRETVAGRNPQGHISVLNTLRQKPTDAYIVEDIKTKPEEYASGMGMVKGTAGIWEEK